MYTMTGGSVWSAIRMGGLMAVVTGALALTACTDSVVSAEALPSNGGAAEPIANVGTADLILHNGHVVTVDAAFSKAQAIAIQGNTLLAVGADQEALAFQTHHTRVIDLKGATVIPGINDSHIHLGMWALSLGEIDLRGKTIEEIEASVKQRVALTEPGEVIRGVGWSEASLGRLPTRADLDDYTPDNPVVFKEMGHGYWVNSRMLELAGITDTTTAPEGVKFERHPDTGELTGVLHEARELILPHIPTASDPEMERTILDALEILNAQGITSLTVPGVNREDVAVYQDLADADLLTARISLHLRLGRSLSEAQELLAEAGTPFKGEGVRRGLLTHRGVKLMLDGAPPGRTALMFDDYPCCPGERGLLVYRGETEDQQIEEIFRTIHWLHRQGYQMGIHADGDRSTHIAINALVQAMAEYPIGSPPPQNVLRHYMIHGDLVTDEDIARMAEWDIGLTVQPVITYAAGELLLEIWGQERGERHMATGLFVNGRVWTSISTDAPIVPPDWKQNIEYAVLRENEGSPGELNGVDAYRVSVEQALVAHTRTPAYQDFQELRKGSIEVGKLADLVVIDRDILSIAPQEISDIVTLMTVVDGVVVYEAPAIRP